MVITVPVPAVADESSRPVPAPSHPSPSPTPTLSQPPPPGTDLSFVISNVSPAMTPEPVAVPESDHTDACKGWNFTGRCTRQEQHGRCRWNHKCNVCGGAHAAVYVHKEVTGKSRRCRRFNAGSCPPGSYCKWRHECLECGGPHSALDCSSRGDDGSSRSQQCSTAKQNRSVPNSLLAVPDLPILTEPAPDASVAPASPGSDDPPRLESIPGSVSLERGARVSEHETRANGDRAVGAKRSRLVDSGDSLRVVAHSTTASPSARTTTTKTRDENAQDGASDSPATTVRSRDGGRDRDSAPHRGTTKREREYSPPRREGGRREHDHSDRSPLLARRGEGRRGRDTSPPPTRRDSDGRREKEYSRDKYSPPPRRRERNASPPPPSTLVARESGFRDGQGASHRVPIVAGQEPSSSPRYGVKHYPTACHHWNWSVGGTGCDSEKCKWKHVCCVCGSNHPAHGRHRAPTSMLCPGYNERGRCMNKKPCAWVHECASCGGPHAAVACPTERAGESTPHGASHSTSSSDDKREAASRKGECRKEGDARARSSVGDHKTVVPAPLTKSSERATRRTPEPPNTSMMTAEEKVIEFSCSPHTKRSCVTAQKLEH